jgi:hypothetical protein
MSKSQMKTLLITYFDIKHITHFKFIPQGQTVSQAYYVVILRGLWEGVHKGLNFLPNWFLHHDTSPAHKVLSVKQFLAQKLISEHPPYSPDLALNDFWLFPKINSTLMGLSFQ